MVIFVRFQKYVVVLKVNSGIQRLVLGWVFTLIFFIFGWGGGGGEYAFWLYPMTF